MSGSQALASSIINLLKEKTKAAMLEQIDLDSRVADIAIDFVFSGMLSVYQHWLMSDRSQKLSDVSEVISVMSFSGLNGVFNAYV